jgi:hypothetical protein
MNQPASIPALFEGKQVRWIVVDGICYFSIVDVIGLLAESKNPRVYWAQMKRRVQTEGFAEVFTKCKQLKMPSADGKSYVTDAADLQTLFRIIQSIPSPHAEPVKQWLAQTGAERVAEMTDPALAVDRARAYYVALGYSEEWIEERLRSIVVREELTAEWRDRGAQEGREFAILTNKLHQGTFELGVEEHKAIKNLKKNHNLRDSMTRLELILTQLAEATATEIHQARDSQGFLALQGDVQKAGRIAGDTRREIEAETGRPVVSSENFQTLTSKAQQPSLLPPEEPKQDQ